MGEWRRGRMDFPVEHATKPTNQPQTSQTRENARSKKKGVGVIGLHQTRHCRNWLSPYALNAATVRQAMVGLVPA